MSKFTYLLAGVAGAASLAASVPAAAQYYGQSYNYDRGYDDTSAYANQYRNYENQQDWRGYDRGYYRQNTSFAQQQCTSAVQSRLNSRVSIGRILGSMIGTTRTPQVVGITQVSPRGNGMTVVRGIASSGRVAYNNYGPYGEGAYGAEGYAYAASADLSFRCDVGPNGALYNVSINRR